MATVWHVFPNFLTKSASRLEGKMVQITEQLVRKRAEHNELMIGTLEELSLHQEDIERIEHIGNWCRDLRILLLQSNLIPRLENLHRLKRLEYLNVAINNIERIENLSGLESLRKLDLTLNFIGELTSVESLRENYNLRELFLTGNPCTDYPGYRPYVVTVLPQIEHLDGQEVTRGERLKAAKEFPGLRERIVQLEAQNRIERDEQRVRVGRELASNEDDAGNDDDEQRKVTDFWQQKSEHCPETRIQMAKYSRRAAKDRPTSGDLELKKPPRTRKLFADCGRPYSLNEPRLGFDFRDEPDRYELNVHLYRFLDTSLVEVDAQPNYVRITVKGKVFQLALQHEIHPDRATCQRSTTTGHMLIVMPKLNPEQIVPLATRDDKAPATKPANRTNDRKELAGTVNIRTICPPETHDEDDVPELV